MVAPKNDTYVSPPKASPVIESKPVVCDSLIVPDGDVEISTKSVPSSKLPFTNSIELNVAEANVMAVLDFVMEVLALGTDISSADVIATMLMNNRTAVKKRRGEKEELIVSISIAQEILAWLVRVQFVFSTLL